MCLLSGKVCILYIEYSRKAFARVNHVTEDDSLVLHVFSVDTSLATLIVALFTPGNRTPVSDLRWWALGECLTITMPHRVDLAYGHKQESAPTTDEAVGRVNSAHSRMAQGFPLASSLSSTLWSWGPAPADRPISPTICKAAS